MLLPAASTAAVLVRGTREETWCWAVAVASGDRKAIEESMSSRVGAYTDSRGVPVRAPSARWCSATPPAARLERAAAALPTPPPMAAAAAAAAVAEVTLRVGWVRGEYNLLIMLLLEETLEEARSSCVGEQRLLAWDARWWSRASEALLECKLS